MFVKSRKKKDELHLLEDAVAKRTQWRDVLSRFLRSKTGVVGFCIVAILLFLIIFAPLLTSYKYDEQSFPERFSYPSGTHLFGTDDFGRDLFSRIIYGGRVSLLIATCAAIISAVGGVALGLTAGYFGGKTDLIVSRVLEIIMCIPGLLLAIAIAASLGSGPINTAIAISISSIANASRLIRATVMSVRNNEFVEAAKSTGSHHFRIMFIHILPNTIAPLFIHIASSMGNSIMVIAGLSFIGLGVKPPTPEWGAILNAGRPYLREFWPPIVIPLPVHHVYNICIQPARRCASRRTRSAAEGLGGGI